VALPKTPSSSRSPIAQWEGSVGPPLGLPSPTYPSLAGHKTEPGAPDRRPGRPVPGMGGPEPSWMAVAYAITHSRTAHLRPATVQGESVLSMKRSTDGDLGQRSCTQTG
jgi:hypothetical protein